jgi:hypothetical protein
MYVKEETTRLEFVSKVVGQIYTVDIVIISLTTKRYGNNSEIRM